MAELAEGSDIIAANPKDIEELKKKGIPFGQTPPQTIDQLFESRKQKAYPRADKCQPLPLEPEPAIKALYNEIMECILFGLNGAAITLSAILIEYVLKYATFIKEAGSYQNADQNKWGKFEEMELAIIINRAKRAGLIDDEQVKKLHSFRETIRNPYSHFNIKKITKNVVIRNVKKLNTETGKITESDIAARDDTIIQAIIKPYMDENYVFPVFNFTKDIVTHLLLKIKEYEQ